MRFKAIAAIFWRERIAAVSLVYLALWLLLAIFAVWVAPHDPNDQNLSASLAMPGNEYWLGADKLGRDNLSRLIFGAQTTFKAGAMAILIPIFIGVPFGILAGYVGGLVEDIFMRIIDGLLSFPGILLALAITGVLGLSLTNTMIAIGIMMTPIFARLARGQTKQIRSVAYIEASQLSGGSSLWIMVKHIAPNIASPLIVQASFSFSVAILVESALSFIGLGAQPPEMSWGMQLQQGYALINSRPYMIFAPAIAISTVILAGNLVGDGLRLALDPRSTREGP